MVLKDNPNWTLIFDWPRKPEKVNKNISGIGLFVRGVEWTGPLSYETNALYIFVLAIFIIDVFNTAGALVGKTDLGACAPLLHPIHSIFCSADIQPPPILFSLSV